MRRPLHLALALALLLAVSTAQNAPSPSPETPVSRYLQVMSDTARSLQKGQPLYDFKARPVKGNGMQTMLQESGSISSCVAPSADSTLCSVVQGLVVMPVTCLVVGLLTFLFWLAFVCARKYFKFCCNNCGSRKPQPDGGKYTKRSKIIIACILFLSSSVIIAISSMAISAAYDAPDTIARFYGSVLDFLDQATSFLNSANSFILANGANIGLAISSVQTSFSSLQNSLNSSQISALGDLQSMTRSLNIIQNTCANFSASPPSVAVCNSMVASFRSKISSSTSSLTKFEVKSLALNNVASDVVPRLANNTQPTRDAIVSGSAFTTNSRKSLLTFQIESSNPQGQAQMGTLLLFGSMWLIPLFFTFAFMCQKWTHWYFTLWLSFLGSLVFWVLLAGLYVVSYILNNTCDLVPTLASPRATQPLATGISSPFLQSFFDVCVTQGGSRALFQVVNVSTAVLDKQIADFSLSKQINVSYISTYNQTLLQDVRDNQVVFNSLNATSFILSDGVAIGTAALQAIQNNAQCGSRTFTVNNAYECLTLCSAAAMGDCRKAAAYGDVSVHALLLSSVNPVLLGSISSMNSTVTDILPSITAADALLKSVLSTLSAGFARFNECAWIGRSFVSIRTNLCGNVADTINVMWLCCGILAFVLMYIPIVVVKAEKRFKRLNLAKEASLFRDKHREVMNNAKEQRKLNPPMSPSFQGFLERVRGAAAGTAASQAAQQPVVIVDVPQTFMPSAPPLQSSSISISSAHNAAANYSNNPPNYSNNPPNYSNKPPNAAPVMQARGPLRNPYT